MIRLVLRSLARNRWRSALTLGGVALGVGLIVWMSAFLDAYLVALARGATAGQLGLIQVHDADYADKPALWETLPLDGGLLEATGAAPGVAAVAPRLHGMGLVGNERRSRVAMVVGVDAEREPRVTVVRDGIRAGRWLSATPPEGADAREIVLGSGLAKQLAVAVGDELVIDLVTADGARGDDNVRVVGLLTTGNADVDRASAYMHLADAGFLMALEGRAHELAFALNQGADLDLTRDALRAVIPEGAVARTWRELVPDLVQMLDISGASMFVMYAIIFALIALGILNTQRMSALERRRELGVLTAIGTTPGRLTGQLVLEGVFLSTLGAIVGVALGGALVAYHAAAGFDMAAFGGSGTEGLSTLGISFDERLFFELDWAALAPPIIATAAVSLLCALWPALKAARANPVTAINGRG